MYINILILTCINQTTNLPTYQTTKFSKYINQNAKLTTHINQTTKISNYENVKINQTIGYQHTKLSKESIL